jgi:diguanylate cyclase (GGDEF)-like protein
MGLEHLPEHVVRPILTSHVPPALAVLFARLPRNAVLSAELPEGELAPQALLQLLKLAMHGGPPQLGEVRLCGDAARARVTLRCGDRVFEARGEAIDADARALVRRALPALLEPAELAAIADDLAGDASKRATMQHVVRAMLEAADVHAAVHAMLTGITSGDCLGFHRAALFVRDPERGAYVGSQAIGPRDRAQAHRIWEEIEAERKSIDAMIEGYARHEVDTRLQVFVQTLTLRPGDGADDEVAAAERAERAVLPFRRGRPVNAGLAALGPAEEFVLAAVRPHGEVLGLIFVDDAFEDREIGAERVGDLEFFVDQAALVWENSSLLERVASLARKDALTGLLNRRELEARFATEASRARRSGSPCGLLLVDVDNFKQINDSQGHEQGDEALRRIAAVLQRAVRGHDTVARYGGDEFVVVLPATPRADVAAAARRIGRLVAEAGFSVSIGAATWPDDCAEIGELFAAADASLYRAKRAGRARACMPGGDPFGFDAAR